MGQWWKCSMLWFVVLIVACSLSVWAAEVPQSLVIAVVNPPNFHHEVLFGVMQCLSDHATKAHATGSRDVEVDLYLGAAAVVDNAMGTRDILRPFSEHMRVSYPRVLHWRPGMQDSELWKAPAGSAAPLRKPDLCIAISPEYSVSRANAPLFNTLNCSYAVAFLHGGVMGATSKDIRAALAAYQPFAFNEFVTLGQHVADSMERESGIKSRWAVPVYRLRHWAAPPRPSYPGTATPGSSVPQMRHSSSEPSVRSKASSGAGSGPGAICQQYLTVQGKMDGRRALVPLWAALAEAGMAGNGSALCVKVLGASRSQRPEELPALLSVPDQLASRVQVVPNLPYTHFYAAIAQSAALVPAIIDSSPSSTSPAQSSHPGRLSVNRSEYSSKRFTSSVITALICETPLLTSSVEEQRLLSSVYTYLRQARALLGPLDFPLADLTTATATTAAATNNTATTQPSTSSAGALDSSPSPDQATARGHGFVQLQQGRRALARVADQMNQQFRQMLEGWLGQAAGRR